jgi:hypothetical protein
MTGPVTVADVQWALYGKAAGASGDRVLACSAGDLTMVNFADAISRFQLGALHTLPQVSVSYAQPVKPGGSYLALAIHRPADQGQVALDEDGRHVTQLLLPALRAARRRRCHLPGHARGAA